MKTYRIKQTHTNGKTYFVSAPVGYYRTKTGGIERDGTPSPELTDNPSHAFRFKSRMAAARTAGKMYKPVIY